MILTKKSLRNLLENMWISILESLEKELLSDYGRPVMDDEGHMRVYRARYFEQVRKRLIHAGYFR